MFGLDLGRTWQQLMVCFAIALYRGLDLPKGESEKSGQDVFPWDPNWVLRLPCNLSPLFGGDPHTFPQDESLLLL